MKEEGTILKIQTTIKKSTVEGNAEERDTPEAEATNEEHTKTGDRLIVDEEKDNTKLGLSWAKLSQSWDCGLIEI